MSNIKLLNGDSYKLIKDIPDKSVDLVYIDIPYEYESGGKDVGFIMKSKVVKEFYSKEVDKISYGIDYSIFDELIRVLRHIYIYIYGVLGIKYYLLQNTL